MRCFTQGHMQEYADLIMSAIGPLMQLIPQNVIHKISTINAKFIKHYKTDSVTNSSMSSGRETRKQDKKKRYFVSALESARKEN